MWVYYNFVVTFPSSLMVGDLRVGVQTLALPANFDPGLPQNLQKDDS